MDVALLQSFIQLVNPSLGIAMVVLALLLVFYPRRRSTATLEVTQLYAYPIKGIRGTALQKACIGRYGLVGDRTFCLQKVHRNGSNKTHKTMLAGLDLQLALFRAAIRYDERSANETGEVVVTWDGRSTQLDTTHEIRFPLNPPTDSLDEMEIDLHGSSTKAYDMGDDLSKWFADRLGFEARLVYIGECSRAVLGSLAPHGQKGLQKSSGLVGQLQAMLPFNQYPAERLVFADIAHYLVVTEESNNHVTSLLTDGYTMDITKFRPNIVVKGASGPFVEDFWGELTFDGNIRMPLTANCHRCQSITVDFNTGKPATDDRGTVWKKLNKTRRVDKGAKYSPVFGRYGYCFGSSVGKTIVVGQEARVTRVNRERTIFDWPGLAVYGVKK
ncbi:hypothetical protein MPDQ_007540 [Monascus purpureus]|uniref:MOSC domain-containing protein n=1 Tax=Monascus purpureus TaxID=5098 RepID=A0A507QVZ5_MONPU|nr:hypothetical protein MPDQ_007540 [Monascus purpureus]BDD54449.1 hypothetical protein MAP00_000067 [Monascus purpureus]